MRLFCERTWNKKKYTGPTFVLNFYFDAQFSAATLAVCFFPGELVGYPEYCFNVQINRQFDERYTQGLVALNIGVLV